MTHRVTAIVLNRQTDESAIVEYVNHGGAFAVFEGLLTAIERILEIKFDDAHHEVISVTIINVDRINESKWSPDPLQDRMAEADLG